MVGAGTLGACATTGAAPNASDSFQYRLGPADQLRITVYNEPELTGQFVVGAEGAISYPLVGSIEAAGLTVDEFSEALRVIRSRRNWREPSQSRPARAAPPRWRRPHARIARR